VNDAPVAVCDLDGVLWRGDEPVPGAADGVAMLRAGGVRVVFLTNNSSGTVADYVRRLVRVGVPAEGRDVLSSAAAAAALLARDLPRGARVLACAGAGVREALAEHGLTVVDAGPAEAVVVGWHRDFDFARLTTSTSRHRFVLDSGRVSAITTVSPTRASFASSWTWNFRVRSICLP